MHIPLSPPDTTAILAGLAPDQMIRLLGHGGPPSPLVNGAYLHWDELRHRAPPDGLTHEQWWVRVKLARQVQYKQLPLLDKTGQPFVISVPETIQIDLHHIDRDAAGQIAAANATSPANGEHRDRYLMHSLIEEAITSSQLEGASTTRRVAEQMLREGRRPRDTSERMIFNNFRAMEMIRSMRDEAISPERILEIHRLVSEGTLDDPSEAGRFRQDDGVEVRDRQDNRLLHQPPR